MESEGGGEDEGGEGDAVGDQFNWEVSSATWANTNQENICVIVIPNLNSAFIKVQFILFCSSKKMCILCKKKFRLKTDSDHILSS